MQNLFFKTLHIFLKRNYQGYDTEHWKLILAHELLEYVAAHSKSAHLESVLDSLTAYLDEMEV